MSILTDEPRGIHADTMGVNRVAIGTDKPYVLLSLSAFPGRWKVALIDDREIYSDFTAEYIFEKDGNYWQTDLRIVVTELGLPTLKEVTVHGYIELGEWELTVLELDLDTVKAPLVSNVERWQLNLVTELRHRLLKDAVTYALSTGIHTKTRPGITAVELKAIERKIDKVIAKRVVTDDLLKQVADVYSEGKRNGLPDPITEVMALTDRSFRRSQEYVQMAREKGLLPKTTQGKVTINKPKRKKGK